MNLIKALREAKGRPVRREAWGYSGSNEVNLSIEDGILSFFGDRVACLSEQHLLADDWYVVEPKSKIEQAIERELNAFPFSQYQKAREIYSSSLRRFANFALDEAIGIEESARNKGLSYSDCIKLIQSLKVKE